MISLVEVMVYCEVKMMAALLVVEMAAGKGFLWVVCLVHMMVERLVDSLVD